MTDNKVELLSRLLSESYIDNEGSSEIDDTFMELYSMIDEDMMRIVSPICFEDNYTIVQKLKQLLSAYRVYFYFPEIIHKNIIAVYSSQTYNKYLRSNTACSKLLNELVFSAKIKKGLFDSEWLPLNVPCIFTNNNSDFRLLSISGNTFDIGQADYIELRKLIKDGFDERSLMTIFSVNTTNLPNDVALLTIPTRNTVLEYRQMIMSFTSTVIVDEQSIEDFCLDFEDGCFPCLSQIYCINKSVQSRLKKLNLDSSVTITDRADLEFDALIGLSSTAGTHTSINLRFNVEYNNIVQYVADLIALNSSKFDTLNKDITCSDDERIVEVLKSIRSGLSKLIDTENKSYKELIDFRNSINERIAGLEAIEKQIYCEMTGDSSEDNRQGPINITIAKKLFTQSISFLRAFKKDSGIRSEIKSLMDSISSCGDELTIVTMELLFNAALGKKLDTDKLITVLCRTTDPFVIYAQIAFIGFGYDIDSLIKQTGIADLLDILSSNALAVEKECKKYFELRLLGLGYYNKGKTSYGLRLLWRALQSGSVDAGNDIIRIINYDYLTKGEIQKLVTYAVPVAINREAERLFNSDDEKQQKQGITYYKLAAAYGDKDALNVIIDVYYNLLIRYSKPDGKEDDGFNELVKFNIVCLKHAEQSNKSNKSYAEKLGIIYYNIKQYSQALTYLLKANTTDCMYYIGRIYEKGLECAVDFDKAIMYYERGANQKCSKCERALDRIERKIAEKRAAAERKRREEEEYNDSGFSVDDYLSNYDSGCVVAGTQIQLSDGGSIAIENIVANTGIRNCRGNVSYTSQEFIVNKDVAQLYSINDDEPFMSLEHAILTNRGWCSLDPKASMALNPYFEVGMLELGDTIKKRCLVDGVWVECDCVVEKINVINNDKQLVCYDLHFYDGDNSYYANGYPCLLNYPQITLASLSQSLDSMADNDKIAFCKLVCENRGLFEQVFGRAAIEMFINTVS